MSMAIASLLLGVFAFCVGVFTLTLVWIAVWRDRHHKEPSSGWKLGPLRWRVKDGGPESRVWMYGLELKCCFSILFLRFGLGSREMFHSHAFNCVSWVLCGGLHEVFRPKLLIAALWRDCSACRKYEDHMPSFLPFHTYRDTVHKVHGLAPSTWVLTIRGPWARAWMEFDPTTGAEQLLTEHRQPWDDTH